MNDPRPILAGPPTVHGAVSRTLITDRVVGFYRAMLDLTRRRGLFTLAKINARMFPSGQYVGLPAGARLFVPPDPHFFGFVLGTHEQHITDILIASIKPGDICVDVGANIGYFSAIMAQLAGNSGEVLSFEPVPENFSILERNAAIASATGATVKAINAAVSERQGPVRIVRREYSTYHQVEPATASSTDSIQGICLDEELPHLVAGSRVSFLKIDVEGHELSVLRGTRRSLMGGLVNRLVVEVTPGAEAAEIGDIISKCARRVECWVDGAWRNQSITSLTKRTDVFVECTTK
jgi:FkbM family methyltransferase